MIQQRYLSAETFDAVCTDVLRQAEITPDRNTCVTSTDYYSNSLEAASSNNELDIVIQVHRRGQSGLRPLLDESTAPEAGVLNDMRPPSDGVNLHGLLRNCEGYFLAQLPVGPWKEDKTHWSRLEIMSSTQAINDVQRALGRQPGSDVFCITDHERAGYYTGGEAVEAAARLCVLASARGDTYVRQHDLDPADHIQGWLSLPPAFCQAIQAKAMNIQAEHGAAIHLPIDDPDRPAVVAQFANSLDRFADFNRPLFDTVYRVGESGNMWELNDGYNQMAQGRRARNRAANFTNIGIMDLPAQSSSALIRQETKRVHAAIITQLASMFAMVAEIQPRPDLTTGQTRQQIDNWHAVQERFSRAV